MSNNSWSATNDDQTEFSYRTNERNYTGIYLNREFLEDISIIVPNEPENIGETTSSDMEVVHTLGQLHQSEHNSEILPGSVIEINESNETPSLQLNSETVESVFKPHYRNNTEPSPFPIDDNVDYDPNIGNITESYIPTSIQHSMPAKQRENGQFSACRTVNISQSYSSAFRPPDQNQYRINNNTLRLQEYDRYSSRVPPSSSNRCESVIKYCKPIQNKFEAFNTSTRDPRLVNRDQNKYIENRLDKFEGLRRIRYTNKKTYLNEDLRIINMKLKNMNSSYRFGVVNDLSEDDNFNEHNIRRRGEPSVKNTQTDRGAETYIDCNKYLKLLNTERHQKINSGKVLDVIDLMDDNGGVAREIEARRTSSVLQQYRIEKTELRKLREDHQKKLAETVENIIDSLNDDTSDLRCTTETLSKKNDGVIKIHNLNDQTKNNVGKANENTLIVENYNFDNTIKKVDIYGLIEKNQKNKPLSEQSIETIDLTHDDTSDSIINQYVDTGMSPTKLKDPKIMSMGNERKLEKNNKSSEKLNTSKTDKNELKNGLDGIALLGYETFNINKIRVKNTSQLIENDQNEIINSMETAIGEPRVGVQSNPNTSTKSTKSATNVVGKTHYTHDELSIRVQDSRETTESNLTDRSSSYKNRRSSTDLEKRIHNAFELLRQGTNEHSLKSNTVQSLPSPGQDESGMHVEGRRIIGDPENMFNKKSTKYYATSDSRCESNEEQFKIESFKNVDDEKSMSNTGHQNTDTSETSGSSEDDTQSQTADFMIDILPPVVHRYNSIMDVEKEVPYIKLSEQILNENSKSCDENEFNYDLSQMEQSEDSDDEPVLTIDMQATDSDEPGLNEPLEDATQSSRDSFIGDGNADDHKDDTDIEESARTTFVDHVSDEHFEKRKLKKGLNNEQKVRSVENQDTKLGEFIDDEAELPNVQRLAGDDVLSADEPPAEQPPADGHIVGELNIET
ncbi:uncharacterized protein LOC111038949 [Myzus persicae]|uniref:uncharacterized protein LOC111038949 n=1 Tax=Myzus persicae TaxID=13164 RepID=UPI000B93990C|nr:uncharacterized protein LOC111038949 [Myzus persicae]